MSGLRDASRRELVLLGGAMSLALAVTIVYVLATKSPPLEADQRDYHEYGQLFADGKWWWVTGPFDEPHASALKAPLYPLWVGFVYSVFGVHDLAVELLQALLAPLTVLIGWVLARRLFGARVATVSAFVVALFPLAFEFYGRLYPEALAVPLVLGTIALFLGAEPSPRLVLASGALLGVNLLLRPTSVFLLAGMLVYWVIAVGPRRGAGYAALAAAIAALVVAPWTIRNAIVLDAFIPISIQDAAVHGTFNEISANDPVLPYQWRPATPELEALLAREPEPTEPELRDQLEEWAFEYIGDHPDAIPKAIWWNGIVRSWDLRRPKWAIDEAKIQGRSWKVTALGLAAYYVLLPLAVLGLWFLRRRREVLLPLLAMVAASAILFAVVAVTRYRAPAEPLIAILATYAAFELRDRWAARGRGTEGEGRTESI